MRKDLLCVFKRKQFFYPGVLEFAIMLIKFVINLPERGLHNGIITVLLASGEIKHSCNEGNKRRCIVILNFYTAANVHSAIKQLLRIIHTSLAIENFFM